MISSQLSRLPRLPWSASRTMSTTPLATTRPANWKTLAPSPLPGPTFGGQSSLPRLPVPSLSETLAKFKETLKPIAWSEQEYIEAVEAVDHFGASPYARELQDRLQRRSEEPGRLHWLEEWWDDGGYLGYRDSVSILPASFVVNDAYAAMRLRLSSTSLISVRKTAVQFRSPFRTHPVQMASMTTPQACHRRPSIVQPRLCAPL